MAEGFNKKFQDQKASRDANHRPFSYGDGKASRNNEMDVSRNRRNQDFNSFPSTVPSFTRFTTLNDTFFTQQGLPADNNSSMKPLTATTPSFNAASKNNSKIKSNMPLTWALAPEFKPKNFQPASYSMVLRNDFNGGMVGGVLHGEVKEGVGRVVDGGNNEDRALALMDKPSCLVVCEICHLFVDSNNLSHSEECQKASENYKLKEAVFAISSKQTCSICLEIVWQKQPKSSQRFGLLSDCNHVFCLECIRKWRKNNSADDEVLKACPVCRTRTDFVVPSYNWFHDESDKKNIIDAYKAALKKKPCKYFSKSQTCPFGDSCFYSHKDKNGKEVLNVKKQRRYRVADDGQTSVVLNNLLFEFIEESWRNISLLDVADDDDDDDDNEIFSPDFYDNYIFHSTFDDDFDSDYELFDLYLS